MLIKEQLILRYQIDLQQRADEKLVVKSCLKPSVSSIVFWDVTFEVSSFLEDEVEDEWKWWHRFKSVKFLGKYSPVLPQKYNEL